MNRLVIGVGVAIWAAMSAASAQSLKDIRARESEEQTLSAEAAFTSEVCGETISASIDWSTARDWPDNQSLASACDGALGAIEAICRAGARGRVNRFVCGGDGSGPRLSGKTLRYGARPGVNGFAETKAALDAAR